MAMLVVRASVIWLGMGVSGRDMGYVLFVVVYCCVLIFYFQAGYHATERDCRARSSGEFDGGSVMVEGSKTFRWKRNPFGGSGWVEDDDWEQDGRYLVLPLYPGFDVCDFVLFYSVDLVIGGFMVAG